MLETGLAILIGLVIGGSVAWWGREIRELLVRLLLKREKPEGGVVRPPAAALIPKGVPQVLSSTGVVKPPSPSQIAREAMEEARNR
jgi:hypothetical protein